jgi:hypothetical protein
MDKVRKPSNSVCYTPSSEPYRIYVFLLICKLYETETCAKWDMFLILRHPSLHRYDREEYAYSLLERNVLPPHSRFLVASSCCLAQAEAFLRNVGELHRTTRCHMPEDHTLHSDRCENLRSSRYHWISVRIR